MNVLVVSLVVGGKVPVATRHTLTCAEKIAPEVDVLLIGEVPEDAATQVASFSGVRSVFVCQMASVGAEGGACQVKAQSEGYSLILFDAGTLGKAVMPRVAALLGVPALSEICDVVSPDTFKRYIYAGSLLATVKIAATPVIASVRTTAFDPVLEKESPSLVQNVEPVPSPRAFTLVSTQKKREDTVDLESARIVVAAGRGVIDEAGFKTAEKLADRLHAGLASTRALVDAFIAPADTQVGQTGKIVAPDLYLAFGISGAIQHLAGMKDSKVIVAVNTDPEAPIIDVCDYWLEADAVQTLEALYKKL